MLISDGSKEYAPSKWGIILYTLFLFLLMHVWQPFVEPLSSTESLHALTAVDILSGRGAGRLIAADGNLIDFPLYSLSLAIVGSFTHLTDFSCRLPQLFAILVMTLMSGYVTARSAGHRAGLTAASVVLVSFGLGFFNPTGNTLLGAMLLSTAWFLWYRSSRVWNWNWIIVWVTALLPISCAVMAIGFKAIIFFYLPLVFLHRPLKARKRLSQYQHLIAVSIVLILFFWIKSYIFEGKVLMEIMSGDSYSMFQFLFIIAAFCCPWVFVGWPILCMAFQSVEKTPVFNHYIRTILISVLLWSFLFSRSSENLLFLLPVFAVGTGVNYNMFLRRYYLQVRYVGRALIILTYLSTLWGGITLLLVQFKVGDYAGMHSGSVVRSFAAGCALSLLATLLFLMKKRFMIYSCRLAVISACFIGTVLALKEGTTTDFDYKWHARMLVQNVDLNKPVYLLLKREAYREAYNMRHNIINIQDTEALPGKEEVYVITNGSAPIQETRTWKQLQTVKFPDGHLALWLGEERPALTENYDETND